MRQAAKHNCGVYPRAYSVWLDFRRAVTASSKQPVSIYSIASNRAKCYPPGLLILLLRAELKKVFFGHNLISKCIDKTYSESSGCLLTRYRRKNIAVLNLFTARQLRTLIS